MKEEVIECTVAAEYLKMTLLSCARFFLFILHQEYASVTLKCLKTREYLLLIVGIQLIAMIKPKILITVKIKT